jgi:hypothetical protein
MEQSIIDLLINGSPMAGFAAFLGYNFFHNRKQIQTMNDKQFELFRELQQEKELQIEKLRGRYDTVIERLETRDTNLRTSIESRLEQLESTLTTIVTKLTNMTDRLQKLEIQSEIQKNLK